VTLEFHLAVEMMEANDVLLGTMLRDRLRPLAQIGEPRPKIEELHPTTPEPDTAQKTRR
jgi:hypothetical protein